MKNGVNITLEHLKPLSKGGGNDLDNLGLSCLSCNAMKGDMEHEVFMSIMRAMKDGLLAKSDVKDYLRYKDMQKRFKDIEL